MMRFGAHKSIAGGYDKAAERVQDIGGNTLQIFSTAPRGWKPGNPSEEECGRFQQCCTDNDIAPIYFHASYLVNLAGRKETQHKSMDALIAELTTAARCGVRGSVVHVGSFVGEDKGAQGEELTRSKYEGLLQNIERILAETPKETLFIVENMGMRKIGRTVEEIGFVVRELNDDRVRVCLDTCHLHTAGYDLSDTNKLDQFLDHFDEHIGRDRLELWHMNDSRDEFGSLRDRHENIGEGYVGEAVFETIVNHAEMKDFPFIIETPGFDDNGPDKKNLDRLKALVRDP